VCLDNHTYPTPCGLSENIRKLRLCSRVEVYLRLLNINNLPRTGRKKCHYNRKRLRKAHTNVGYINKVVCTAARGVW